MKPGYSHPVDYTVEDQLLARELIKAQEGQGNVGVLQPQVSDKSFCPGNLLKEKILD